MSLLGLQLGVVLRSFHAERVGVVPGGQLGAVEGVGPAEAELLHDGGALEPGLLTHGPAGGDGGGHLVGAHGDVEGAEEEAEVDVAAVLHQRGKLIQFDASLRLALVLHEVGHPGHVVANALTHGDGDGFTFSRSAPLYIVGSYLQTEAGYNVLAP